MATTGAAPEEKVDLEADVRKKRESSAIFPPNRFGHTDTSLVCYGNRFFGFQVLRSTRSVPDCCYTVRCTRQPPRCRPLCSAK